MIEQHGIVIETGGHMAAVTGLGGDGCSSCKVSAGCGAASLVRFFQRRKRILWVRNPIAARSGDRVIVGMDESTFLRMAMLAYALPVFALLSGAIIGDQLASAGSEEPMAVIFGLIGLIGGLWIARGLSTSIVTNKRHQASITQILVPNSDTSMVSAADLKPHGNKLTERI